MANDIEQLLKNENLFIAKRITYGTFCNMKIVENEYHFLLVGPAYSYLRCNFSLKIAINIVMFYAE